MQDIKKISIKYNQNLKTYVVYFDYEDGSTITRYIPSIVKIEDNGYDPESNNYAETETEIKYLISEDIEEDEE